MATTNPRFTLTLPPADLSVLDRLAAATGTPRATLAAGFLSAAIPQMKEAAILIEMANAAPHKLRQSVVDDLRRATDAAMGQLQPAGQAYSRLMDDLQGELNLDGKKRKARPGSVAPGATAPTGKGKKRLQDPRSLTGGSK